MVFNVQHCKYVTDFEPDVKSLCHTWVFHCQLKVLIYIKLLVGKGGEWISRLFIINLQINTFHLFTSSGGASAC